MITVRVHTSWESLLHLMVFAQAISVHGQFVCLTITFPFQAPPCLATRENMAMPPGKNKGWAPAAEQHTKNSYSGWSKRGTRGYQCDYENRSRQWEDYKASGLTKDIEGVPEAVVVAEVEAEDNRDKHLGRATADSVAHTAPAHSASSAAAATEKEALRTRLEKLKRLLNNRKGSVNATYKKNAEANDRAFVMNQRTIQPLGAVAEEYTSFEATMKKSHVGA